MTKSNIVCHYHPERNAITKCEMCQKTICLECKTIYQKRQLNSNTSGISYSRQELCPPCYYDRIIKDKQTSKSAASIAVGIILTFIDIYFLFIPLPFVFKIIFGIIAILGLALTIYGFFKLSGISGNKKAVSEKVGDLEAKKRDFLENITSPTKTRERNKKNKYCSFCGNEINLNENICINCGNEI
ncbi:MAG: hypothetical protein ACFFAS_04135 [Promethearchaeota archaeon]